jgi:hypothetical protein
VLASAARSLLRHVLHRERVLRNIASHPATSRPALRPNSRHGGRFSCCTICHASPAYRRLNSDSLTERQPWSLTVGVLPWCHLCCDLPICLRKGHRWLFLLSVSFCNRMEACLTCTLRRCLTDASMLSERTGKFSYKFPSYASHHCGDLSCTELLTVPMSYTVADVL